MAYNDRCKFWFGTEQHAEFFQTPLQGADSSPSAWGADGTLLNGGGWALNSWGSHKRYSYEWAASSSREVAQKMKSYRDGTYGRGLLYFLEPTIFTTNVLPAHWADPSMSIDNEAPSLVYGVDPTPVVTSGFEVLGLPVTSARYDLLGTPYQTAPTPDSSVFIPIPTGHTLYLGAFYSATGDAGVFATPVNDNGTLGSPVKLTPKSNSDTSVVTDSFAGNIKGVRLWVGHRFGVIGQSSTLTISAMIGRLIETAKIPPPSTPGLFPSLDLYPSDSLFPSGGIPGSLGSLERGPWIGGQGHSGCRFLGTPTYVTNSPIEGGRIGFAASFVETGSWAYG